MRGARPCVCGLVQKTRHEAPAQDNSPSASASHVREGAGGAERNAATMGSANMGSAQTEARQESTGILAGRSLFTAGVRAGAGGVGAVGGGAGGVALGGMVAMFASPGYLEHPCSSTGFLAPFSNRLYPWVGSAGCMGGMQGMRGMGGVSAAHGAGLWNAAGGVPGGIPWGWQAHSTRALQLQHCKPMPDATTGGRVGVGVGAGVGVGVGVGICVWCVGVWRCTYTCIHTHIHIYTYIHIYIYTYIHMYMYTCIHVYMYTCYIQTNIFVCVCRHRLQSGWHQT